MKRITVICFLLSLCLSAYQGNRFIGGVSWAQAYNPLPIFQVTIENNVSKVVTVMYVFAPTEENARENVSLNGWKVRGIKKLSDSEKAQITLSDDGLNSEGESKIVINSFDENIPAKDTKTKQQEPKKSAEPVGTNMGSAPLTLPADNLTDMNKPRDNASPDNTTDPLSAMPMESSQGSLGTAAEKVSGKVAEDNLEILPDSPELEYLLTLNFNFAEIDPKLNEQLLYRLKELPVDRRYIIFGHADDVVVGKNAIYKNNYTLSYMRAEEIKKLMAGNGVAADNIKTVGLGVKYPLEDTKGSSLANRRAEIYGFRTQE